MHSSKSLKVAGISVAFALGLNGCGNSDELVKAHNEAAMLKERVEKLETELSELKNGPQRRIEAIRADFKDHKYKEVVAQAEELKSLHRGSAEDLEATALAIQAGSAIADLARKEEERAAFEAATKKKAEAERVAKLEAARKVALRNIKKEVDSVRDIVFYIHKSSPPYLNSRSNLQPYIGVNGSTVFLRLKNVYVSDEWLFVEKFIVKVDDRVYEIVPDEVERDNGYGKIWEWVDENVIPEHEEMLKAIAKSKNTTIRYVGKQYYRDRAIGATKKKSHCRCTHCPRRASKIEIVNEA